MSRIVAMSPLEREAAEAYAAALRSGASEVEAAAGIMKHCRERQPGLSDYDLRAIAARAIAISRLARREQVEDASGADSARSDESA